MDLEHLESCNSTPEAQSSSSVLARKRRMYGIVRKQCKHAKYLDLLAAENDVGFTTTLFNKLCSLLHNFGGLRDTNDVPLQEQVTIFLSILGYHKNISSFRSDFLQSGDTVSKYFDPVWNSLGKLYPVLLSKPSPIEADEECERWKCFPGCLGALDCTYVDVQVPTEHRRRYLSTKGTTATKVLVACDVQGRFTYVLSGWEGSASDMQVFKNAVHRPGDGLRVPKGKYYLCDQVITNSEGFLAPYRGVRYHLKEWGVGKAEPQNYQEYFNMKHAQAKSVIDRSIGMLEKRWSVPRSKAYDSPGIKDDIIFGCIWIQNFQLMAMANELSDADLSRKFNEENNPDTGGDFVDTVGSSKEWNIYRDTMANAMYAEWMLTRDNQ